VLVGEWTETRAGPYCAMLLGHFGANVIKIERPKKGQPILCVLEIFITCGTVQAAWLRPSESLGGPWPGVFALDS
jgi:crotonobetainyl-CoA:carnitine CoA-transferase CaiB-like acyl-CoA transferase